MPKQSKSQAIGHEGERWFAAQLPATWIPQLPTYDVGVDAHVIICDEGKANGADFRVQIKSTQRFEIKDNHIIHRGFRVSSFLELVKGFTPALLVFYEADNKRGFCIWANQILAANLEMLNSNSKTTTLRIPLTRRIDSELWPNISLEVSGIITAIGRGIVMSGQTLPLLQVTHDLMQSLSLIDLCANGEGGTVTTRDLIDAEITAHKEIVLALFKFEEELKDVGSPISGISEVGNRYAAACQKFVLNFDEFLYFNGGDFSLKVVPKLMVEYRIEAVRIVNQAVRQLCRLSLESARANH